MDLGQDQQQHPTVNSAGVSRVLFRSPSAHLPLLFSFPSSPLPLYSAPFETWKLGNSETQPFSTVFSHFRRFQLLSAILKRFQPFSTVFNHFQPFSTVVKRFQPFSTILRRFLPILTVFNRFNCFQPFGGT